MATDRCSVLATIDMSISIPDIFSGYTIIVYALYNNSAAENVALMVFRFEQTSKHMRDPSNGLSRSPVLLPQTSAAQR